MATTEPSGLTAKQEAFIVNLLAAPSVAAACRKSKISARTVWRWMQKRAFTEALRAARRKVTEKALVHLTTTATAAASALRRNLRCGDAGQEVRAALGILEMVRDDAIEDRLAALESKLFTGPEQ
jgi:hypothetical protein